MKSESIVGRCFLPLCLLLALLLRLPQLQVSLWLDELWASDLKVGSWARLASTLEGDVHPPLYSLLAAFWNRVFGDSVIALRALPLLCGVASVGLTHALARRSFGMGCARLASLLAAFCVALTELSQEARPYSLTLALGLLILLLLRRRMAGKDRGWLLAFVLSLSLLNHYFSVFFLPLFLPLLRRDVFKLLLATAPLALWLGLKLATGGLETGRAHLSSFDAAAAFAFVFDWIPLGGRGAELESVGSVGRITLALVQGILGLLLLRGSFEAARSREGRLILAALLIPLVGVALMTKLGLDQSYRPRSLIAWLPLVLILLARGAQGMRSLGVVLLLIFAASFVFTQWNRGPWEKADWRGLAEAVGETESSTDARLLLFLSPRYPEPLEYHSEGAIGFPAAPTRSDERVKRLENAIDRVLSIERGLGLWIVDQLRRSEATLHGEVAEREDRLEYLCYRIDDRELGARVDALQLERVDRSRLLLLIHPGEERLAALQELLSESELLERRDFGGLRLLRLRR